MEAKKCHKCGRYYIDIKAGKCPTCGAADIKVKPVKDIPSDMRSDVMFDQIFGGFNESRDK